MVGSISQGTFITHKIIFCTEPSKTAGLMVNNNIGVIIVCFNLCWCDGWIFNVEEAIWDDISTNMSSSRGHGRSAVDFLFLFKVVKDYTPATIIINKQYIPNIHRICKA